MDESGFIDLSIRKGFINAMDTVMDSVAYSDKFLDKDPDYVVISINEVVHFYNKLDSDRPFHNLLLRYMKNPSLFMELEQKLRTRIKNARKTVNATDLSKANKKDLQDLWKSYVDVYYLALRFPNILRKMDYALLNITKEISLDGETITSLSYPIRPSEAFLEHIAIIKADGNISKAKSLLKYACVPTGFHDEKPRDIKYYKKEIKRWKGKTSEVIKIEKENKNHLKLYNQTAKKLPKKIDHYYLFLDISLTSKILQR